MSSPTPIEVPNRRCSIGPGGVAMMGLWWPMRTGACLLAAHGDGSVGFGGVDRQVTRCVQGRLGVVLGRGSQNVLSGGGPRCWWAAAASTITDRSAVGRCRVRCCPSGVVNAVDCGDVLCGRSRSGMCASSTKRPSMTLARAWSVGAAPAVAELTVDFCDEATVKLPLCGTRPSTAPRTGHTKVLGYHLVWTRRGTAESRHRRGDDAVTARMRSGLVSGAATSTSLAMTLARGAMRL